MAQQEKERQKVWFCSDLHFSHVGAVHFHPERLDDVDICLEDFSKDRQASIEHYDEWLIEQWNAKIRKRDSVYILGDLCLGNKERTQYILSKLHGMKYLIRGNHDKSCNGLENYFEWVGDIKEAKFTNNQFKFIDPNETFCVEMCHYPLLTWNRRPHGTICLMGHCHGSLDNFNTDSKELRVDVGYDGNLAKANGGFIELEEIYKYFINIRDAAGCKTFQEYSEWLMAQQGFRM